jgi:hypothetical protein
VIFFMSKGGMFAGNRRRVGPFGEYAMGLNVMNRESPLLRISQSAERFLVP